MNRRSETESKLRVIVRLSLVGRAGRALRCCTEAECRIVGWPERVQPPCDKTIPLTRRLRAPGEVDGESRGLDHDVSSTTGDAVDDKLRRSGGRCPPLPASGDPSRPAVRSVGVVWACSPSRQDAAANPADSMSSRLCWSLCGDILPLWPGSDDRVAAEWYEHRCLVPTSEPQKRV